MGRLVDIFSVNCCFISIVAVGLAVLIPLMWPAPNQPIITAVQRKQYRLIHTLVEQELHQMNLAPERRSNPATIDDIHFGSGRTVMHIAAFHGDLPILKYFKKRGANIQALKDNDGRTPLHLAATFNTVDVVKQLVQWGAVVDARAEAGWTPLLKAVLLSNHDIVAYLLSVGADPNLAVERSFNSVQCAIIYSDDRMIYLLIKAGGYVEEGEKWYEDYKKHYDTIIRTGLLREEDIPQRKFDKTVDRLSQYGESPRGQGASLQDDDDEDDDHMFNDR